MKTTQHLRRHWWRYLLAGLAALLGIYALARQEIAAASAGRLYADVNATPPRAVGLVLGTSRLLGGGEENLYFTYRMDAAAALYKAGKLRYLLVSGDNRNASYDEPAQMRAALLARGVPAAAIYCDFAGITTLDSVLRAREVFGMRDDLMIVSQGFHNQRALYLAAHGGIDAIAFNAPDVNAYYGTRTLARERAARVRAWWDVHVAGRGPHHLGPAIPIGAAPSSCKP